MLRKLRTFFHPERFQGWGRSRKYFEGWYFKVVAREREHAFALIPGIAFDETGKGHAFIQTLNGIRETSRYDKFHVDEFEAKDNVFEVRIAENVFTDKGLVIEMPEISGRLEFSERALWPSSKLRPGIMGPYAFAPFMECYHGIVSMDHALSGHMTIEGRDIDFTGGRGYIEKDWGVSFPSAYIWMQSNHFGEPGISFKASVARIPWLTGSFTGFISFLWLKGELILFATYDKGKLHSLEVSDSTVRVELSNRKYTLSVTGLRSSASHLAAPLSGAMEGRIEESLKAELHLILREKKTGSCVFQGAGLTAGLEVAGPVETLVPE